MGSMVLVSLEYNGLGDLFMKRPLPDDAIKAYSAALEQLGPVSENGLGSDGWRHLVAEIHLKASLAYEAAGRILESRSSAETAQEMLLGLTADHPDMKLWKVELDRASAPNPAFISDRPTLILGRRPGCE